jgi:hypothetical protein
MHEVGWETERQAIPCTAAINAILIKKVET